MQIIPRTPDLLDYSERRGIFRLLTRKNIPEILETISDKPRSALEISKICDICASNVYRTLKILSRYKLVKITGSIGIDGKKWYLYQSKIKSITMTLNSDCCPIVTIFGIPDKSTKTN